MADYYVEWRIDIVAENPREAARQALKIHRDPDSIATVFHVFDDTGKETKIDLDEEDAAAAEAASQALEA